MPATSPMLSLDGTTEEVEAFFHWSASTMKRRNSERPPRIAFYRGEGRYFYGEEAIVEYRASCLVASRRLSAGEAQEIARREWREFKKLCRARTLREDVEGLKERLARIEAALARRLEAA